MCLPLHRPPAVLVAAFFATLLLGGGFSVRAQDRLVFKDGHFQDGKVVGMSGSTVALSVATASGAPGRIGFDLSLLTRVEAAAPPAYGVGMTAYGSGDWEKAFSALKPLVDQYRGLPTPWAQQAAGTLGDLYLEKNDTAKAEEAYNDYRRLYPTAGGNSVHYSLGLARIAFARSNLPLARQQLEILTALALKNPAEASRTDAAAYGQAFYLRGQIREKAGETQAALEDYLRTVTLFYQDNATTARAQKSADALRAAHRDLVAP